MGNAVQGNWGKAAMYAAGALTMGAGAAVIGAVKAVKFATGVAKVYRAARKSTGTVFKGARGWQSNFESRRVGGKYQNNYHVRHR